MKKFIKNNYKYILTYFVIVILLYIHHKYVFMYYDDFGNASLSYSKEIEGVIGTNFNFSQLLESAIYTYNNYGGRVLYGMIASVLLKRGIKPFMMTQVFVITGIILLIHLIVSKMTKKKGIIIPICCMILYSLFDISLLRHGIYWASASILYVWPLLPLLALIYYYLVVIEKIKKKNKPSYILYVLINIPLIILAVFSQEQIGVALLSFLFIYIIFDHIKNEKKYLKYDLFTLILSILTYLAIFLAPGNWKRMSKSTDFANMSFLGKIRLNLPRIMDLLFKVKTSVFINIFLVILLLFMIYYIIKKSKKSKKYYLLSLPVMGMILGLIIYDKKLYTDIILLFYLGTIVLISAFISLLIYYIDNKNMKMIAFPISAICSVFCLLMAPYLVERAAIPCIFIMFISIISIGLELMQKNKTIKTLIILLFVICTYYGALNYINVYKGYKANYNTSLNNYKKLYNNKKNRGTIELCKVENSTYGSTQPYETNHDYWIRQYFDIPYEVNFDWRDCNEKA